MRRLERAPGEDGRRGGAQDATTPLLRALKVASCGSAFVGFGIGWALLSYVVLPILWSFPGSLFERRQRCQRLMGAAWVLFHDYMRWVGLFDFDPRRVSPLSEALSEHGIDGPVVVVANHPCLVDVTALVSGLGPMCFVVKASLMRNPIFGPLLRFTGQVSQSAEDTGGVVTQAVERLRAGHHVLLFPEGTRSAPGALGRFRLGAFEIARAAGVPIVPVAISVDPPSLYKGLPWYQITQRTIRMRVRTLPPIVMDCTGGGLDASRDLMRQVKGAIQQAVGVSQDREGPRQTLEYREVAN